MLTPYGAKEYRVRGSAVVSKALSAGKTLVATTASYPGAAATRSGGETADTPEGFAEALVKIAAALPAYRDAARRFGVGYRERYGFETYIQRCLDAEQAAPLG